MNQNTTDDARAEELRSLSETGRGTSMGTLLRRFWQPVAQSRDIAPGRARAIRRLGEDLTLYRGESGALHIVGSVPTV